MEISGLVVVNRYLIHIDNYNEKNIYFWDPESLPFISRLEFRPKGYLPGPDRDLVMRTTRVLLWVRSRDPDLGIKDPGSEHEEFDPTRNRGGPPEQLC